MSVAIITGCAGLIGSEASRFFGELGLEVAGIDNDMRRHFFGDGGSTLWNLRRLKSEVRGLTHFDLDIRDRDGVFTLFKRYQGAIVLVIHTAAQPSHDWAALDPLRDFEINALGTVNLLEAARLHAPEAPFIFTSTNKVYGDAPNRLPLIETCLRWEIESSHPYACGINEEMPIDQATHSIFGGSKVAADVMVQEYGRYFGLRTVCFRAGCVTGPNHSATESHGFLAYLMKSTATGRPYRIYGYKGKQVRDNIHSADLVNAFDEFFRNPGCGEVYNIGGGREANCSVLEAIAMCEQIAGRRLDHTYIPEHRKGDHVWWISDTSKFTAHYPRWRLRYDVPRILREIHDANAQSWRASDGCGR